MSITQWEIGQEVVVAARTWPGINKPGGHGKIIRINYSSLGVVDSIDVKYTLGNGVDTNLETNLVKPHVQLDRGRRSRRGRDLFTAGSAIVDAPPKKKKQVTKAKDRESTAKDTTEEKENQVRNNKTSKKRKKPTQKKQSKSTSAIDGALLQAIRTQKKRKKAAPSKSRSSGAVKKKSKLAINTGTAATSSGEMAVDDPPKSIPKVIVTTNLSPNTVSPLVVARGHHRTTPEAAFSKQVATKQTIKQKTTTKAFASLDQTQVADSATNFAQRKTLKSVYDAHYQEATNYINSLVGAPEPPQRAADETKKKSAAPKEKSAEERRDEERRQQFGKHFSDAMLRNESTIGEDDLLEAINSCIPPSSSSHTNGNDCCQPFTADEVERYMTRLCAEEKVMKSDGCYYAI